MGLKPYYELDYNRLNSPHLQPNTTAHQYLYRHILNLDEESLFVVGLQPDKSRWG
ncbi:hypothetical protein [Dapis sp. BLCC M229]|uniref:hypothetical protein n=1 Tax=Dapis sp. BLCC M229 TaxID=3400188 RepID=UPI003CE96368